MQIAKSSCKNIQTGISVNISTGISIPIMNISISGRLISGKNITLLLTGKDQYSSTMGEHWDVIIGLVLLFIIIVGISLNSLVLWTLIGLKRSQLHQHQTNTDYYITILASSDLLVALLCYPLTFVSTVSHRWLFGDVGCAINGFFGFFFSLIDIGVLTMMSVLRLLSVKMPHCAFVKSSRYTTMTLVGVVLYALGWTLSPLLGWGQFAPEPFGTSCTVDWKNPNRSYVISVFVGVLGVPLLTMLTCYSGIVYHMHISSLRLGPYTAERKRRTKRQKRLVRMAVIMCFSFLVVWLPYSVLSICFSFVPNFEVHPVYSAIPTVLAKTSHIVNPLICFTTNNSYRRKIKCFLKKTFLSAKPSRKSFRSCRIFQDTPAVTLSDPFTEIPMSTYISSAPSTPQIQSVMPNEPLLYTNF